MRECASAIPTEAEESLIIIGNDSYRCLGPSRPGTVARHDQEYQECFGARRNSAITTRLGVRYRLRRLTPPRAYIDLDAANLSNDAAERPAYSRL